MTYHLINMSSGREVFLQPNEVADFAKKHGLDRGNLYRAINGERQHCGYWRAADLHDFFDRKPWGRNRLCDECRCVGYHHPNCPEA